MAVAFPWADYVHGPLLWKPQTHISGLAVPVTVTLTPQARKTSLDYLRYELHGFFDGTLGTQASISGLQAIEHGTRLMVTHTL